MKKIITVNQFKTVSRIKPLVLAGGCFDILHIGHLRFFHSLKKGNKTLLILLESDKTVARLKGFGRPVNSQKKRAELLAALNIIDYVLLLPELKSDSAYTSLIELISPDIIGLTEDDPIAEKKKLQALAVNAKLLVVPKIKTASTSRLVRILGID